MHSVIFKLESISLVFSPKYSNELGVKLCIKKCLSVKTQHKGFSSLLFLM